MLSGKVSISPNSPLSAPKKLAGILKCKCWCHEEGLREKICVKCLERIASGQEELSDSPPGSTPKK